MRFGKSGAIPVPTSAEKANTNTGGLTHEHGQSSADRRHVGADRIPPSWQEKRPRGHRGRQPWLPRGGALANPDGGSLARHPGALRRPNSVFRRFRRWVKTGVFNALSGDFDPEYAFIDGTVVKVHQKAAGSKNGACRRDRPLPWRVGHQGRRGRGRSRLPGAVH